MGGWQGQWDILEAPVPRTSAGGLDPSSQTWLVCFLVCPSCEGRGQEQGVFSDPGSFLPQAGGGGGEAEAGGEPQP